MTQIIVNADSILQDTLKNLSNHKNGGNLFDNFCRLVYKSIHTKDPRTPNQLGILQETIESEKQTRTVNELYLLKKSMPANHDRKDANPNRLNDPIIIVEYEGVERLIDGSTRITYWHNAGDLTKNLNVNFHKISPLKQPLP